VVYKKIILSLLAVFTLLTACKCHQELSLSGLRCKDFDANVNGQITKLYVLKNTHGMEVCITNYGARVVSIMAPDRNGKMEDVVCGFSNIKDYISQKQNFGATIGRYAGRILNSTFKIDSVQYKLKPIPAFILLMVAILALLQKSGKQNKLPEMCFVLNICQ